MVGSKQENIIKNRKGGMVADTPQDNQVQTTTNDSTEVAQEVNAAIANMPSPDGDGDNATGQNKVAGDVVQPDTSQPAPVASPAPEPAAPAEDPAPEPEIATEPAPDEEEDELSGIQKEPEIAPAPSRDLAGVSDKLIEIKNKALEELRPLIDKLELSPPDKFQLLIKIIRATDDEELVKEAYDIAHQIEDDDLKAEALVDIVNEVDYFATEKNKK